VLQGKKNLLFSMPIKTKKKAVLQLIMYEREMGLIPIDKCQKHYSVCLKTDNNGFG
jgi:hypothetical protein